MYQIKLLFELTELQIQTMTKLGQTLSSKLIREKWIQFLLFFCTGCAPIEGWHWEGINLSRKNRFRARKWESNIRRCLVYKFVAWISSFLPLMSSQAAAYSKASLSTSFLGIWCVLCIPYMGKSNSGENHAYDTLQSSWWLLFQKFWTRFETRDLFDTMRHNAFSICHESSQ